MGKINLGGLHINVTAEGVEDALSKANQLVDKLKEAQELVKELASMKININFGNEGKKIFND